MNPNDPNQRTGGTRNPQVSEDFWDPAPQQPADTSQQSEQNGIGQRESPFAPAAAQPPPPQDQAHPAAPAAPGPTASPSGGKTVVCNHCGHHQTSGSKLCDGCGVRIDAPGYLAGSDDGNTALAPGASLFAMGEDSEWILCGECGVPNRPEGRVCRNCQALLHRREIF